MVGERILVLVNDMDSRDAVAVLLSRFRFDFTLCSSLDELASACVSDAGKLNAVVVGPEMDDAAAQRINTILAPLPMVLLVVVEDPLEPPTMAPGAFADRLLIKIQLPLRARALLQSLSLGNTD